MNTKIFHRFSRLPPPRKKQRVANQAMSYFSTATLKGYTVNPYSKGSKNMINIVFHEGGVPPESRKLVMLLDLGGKALQVKWKVSESLYSDEQATAQCVQVDSARYTGYADTIDRMHWAGVTAIEGYHRGASQMIALDQECTGTPKTHRWSNLTNKEVFWEGQMHRQFNRMYVRWQRATTPLSWAPNLQGSPNLETLRPIVEAVEEAALAAVAAAARVSGVHHHLRWTMQRFR